MLGEKLLSSQGADFGSAWNFGPAPEDAIPVELLVQQFATFWGEPADIRIEPAALHEAHFLCLDASKAKALLNWHPALNTQDALKLTAEWYKAYHENPSNAAEWINQQIVHYATKISE